jgi:ABC-type multidrug transport system fused ATPase/permease subunit
MGFIMKGVDAEKYDRTYSDGQLVRRILRYFRPFWGIMAFIALMVVLDAGMSASLPVLVARGIDSLIESTLTGRAELSRLALVVGAFLLAGVLAWTFNFFRQWFTARTVGSVVLNLREDAFNAVMARDLSFYDEFPTGSIVSRVTSDTQEFATVVTLTLNLMSQFLLVVVVSVILFTINARLAVIALAITPLIVAAALAFRQIARQTSQQARRVLAEVNTKVQESVAGISVAKTFRQESTIFGEFSEVNNRSYDLNLRQGMVFSSIFPILGALAGVGGAVVIYAGGLNVTGGSVSPGEWFLFVESINLFWFPLTSIASFWSQFQLGLSASERVFALIDAEPLVTQIDNLRLNKVAGRIKFENVVFQYNEQEQVFHGFDLTIAENETLALVGHTGAGKSSIGKLIARYYEFQGGRILIDDQDIRSLDLGSYRRHLGLVQQSPFLFTGTVGDNIRYGNPDASDDSVRAVVSSIGGGDWIEALQDGLDTPVSEEGRGISMGQRQLVSLARVLLKDPSIVILDEATASVDPFTEAQIQEGLDVVLQARTAIVIAHRLSTIKAADRIIVIKQGEIIEEGNHDQLLTQAGHYAELYNTYYRHQALDYDPEATSN